MEAVALASSVSFHGTVAALPGTGEAGKLGSFGATVTCDQLIPAVGSGPKDDGLQDAGGFDGGGEFLEGGGVHGGAGLVGVGVDERERDV